LRSQRQRNNKGYPDERSPERPHFLLLEFCGVTRPLTAPFHEQAKNMVGSGAKVGHG
jgi:hypothetical protein